MLELFSSIVAGTLLCFGGYVWGRWSGAKKFERRVVEKLDVEPCCKCLDNPRIVFSKYNKQVLLVCFHKGNCNMSFVEGASLQESVALWNYNHTVRSR